MLDPAEMKRRHESIRATEDSKDEFIKDLMYQLETVQDDLQNEKSEVENQKILVGATMKELKECKNELKESRCDQAKLSFVSVLIDGDCMNFNDNLVQGGHNGGREAARLLKKAVECHVREAESEASPGIQYRIRVYANVHGLAKAYRDAGIIHTDESLDSFVQGFNMENDLGDFVDVGSGKECSDAKIRALFEQDIIDVHCLRVVFCASADNGYARVLGPHRGSNGISLVEGPPFASEMKKLASQFATTSFPEVFRAVKLARRVSYSGSMTITPPRTPAPNYASAARTAPQPQLPSDTNFSTRSTASTNRTMVRLTVSKNARGQRVDNPFHLVGACNYGENCSFDHGRKLNAQQLEDLKYIARLSVCPTGIWCADSSCICAHRCPRQSCRGPGYGCKFPNDMHGVDTTIVTTV